MKLIQIKPEHYIVVDDSEIKEGDWYYDFIYNKIDKCNLYIGKHNTCKKVTHSTQPLNCNCSNRGYKLDTNCAERNHCFGKVQYLPVQEVKELIGEVDVEKKAYEYAINDFDDYAFCGYVKGYNQALEDNKDKKYTEEDLKYMFECGRNYQNNAEITFRVSMEYLQQSKTEWEVEIIDGKLKLK